jgi:hypothetical protein
MAKDCHLCNVCEQCPSAVPEALVQSTNFRQKHTHATHLVECLVEVLRQHVRRLAVIVVLRGLLHGT